MKANEFIRWHGLLESKKHLEWMVRVGARRDIHGWFMDDLKRLIESHELVLLFDDIDCAKAWVSDLDSNWPYQVKGADTKFFKWQLEQAIADVESCM